MARMKSDWLKNHWKSIAGLIVLVSIGVAATLTYAQWKPYAEKLKAYIQNKDLESKKDDKASAAPNETPDTLKLSPQAWKNIGLVTDSVSASDFVKVVSVPAIVAERPGRSQIVGLPHLWADRRHSPVPWSHSHLYSEK